MTDDQLAQIIEAITGLGTGSATGSPGGLECVSIALAGENFEQPVGNSLVMIAEAINRLADAVEGLGSKRP